MAVYGVGMKYHIDPVKILKTWTITDLYDALEAIALQDYYTEQEIGRS